MDYNKFSIDQLSEQAIEAYAEQERTHRVAVRLHPSRARSPRWRMAVAAVAAVAVVAVVAWMARPRVWGEFNGRPLYSLEEAQYYAQQMLDNMTVEELQPQEDILQQIFLLD